MEPAAQPPPPKKRRHRSPSRADMSPAHMPPPAPGVGQRTRARFSAGEMQRQLEALARAGAVESAEMLALLLISAAEQEPAALQLGAAAAERFHARTFELAGDLMERKRELRRALEYYARSQRRLARADPSDEAAAATELLALKTARCHEQLGQAQAAIDALEAVEPSRRSLPALLLLGRLLRGEGLAREAEQCFARALRLNPYALEAAVALAELSAAREAAAAAAGKQQQCEEAEIPEASDGDAAEVQEAAPAAEDAPWMAQLALAHADAARGRLQAALDGFSALEKRFPGNLVTLTQRARLELELEHLPGALLLFQRARQREPFALAHADAMADCLRRRALRAPGRAGGAAAAQQLNALVRELLDVSDAHAEPWLAAGFHAALKGELETALQFSERALAVGGAAGGPARAQLLRGELLLQLRRPERALAAFQAACRALGGGSGGAASALDAHSGVVLSLCELCALGEWERFREAVGAARRAVQLFPARAQSHTLLGRVYALRSEHRERAGRALRRALALEPRNLLASFALADLLVAEGRAHAAVERLAPLADVQPEREDVLAKLAHAYVLDRQLPAAMATLLRARALFPDSGDVARALERVERMLRGEDPEEAGALEGATDASDDN